MSLSAANPHDLCPPAIRAFAQYLFALCVLDAVIGALRLLDLDLGDQFRSVAPRLVAVALALLGAAGAVWAIVRPDRLAVAVWWASTSVLVSGGLSVWLSRAWVIWDIWPAIAVATLVPLVVVPLGWVAFVWWAVRALEVGAAPVVALPAEVAVARTGLSYRARADERHPTPLTHAAALFLLVSSGCTLFANTTALFVLGVKIPAVERLTSPAWLIDGGLNYVRWWLVPALLVGAAIATLRVTSARRFTVVTLALWLGTGLAVVVRDTLNSIWAADVRLFRAAEFLVIANFVVFLFRALRHRW